MSNLNYQTLDTHLEVKMVGEDGVIEGYGAVFGNIDHGMDVIQRGAFTKTLQERGDKVKMLWQHRMDTPIGVWDMIEEDGFGLRVKGTINLNTQQGRECHSLLQQGALDGLSVGFVEVNSNYNDETGARMLTEVKLFEISVVTLPMNEEARIMSVKNNDFTPKTEKPTKIEEELKEELKQEDVFIDTLLKELSPEQKEDDLFDVLLKTIKSPE